MGPEGQKALSKTLPTAQRKAYAGYSEELYDPSARNMLTLRSFCLLSPTENLSQQMSELNLTSVCPIHVRDGAQWELSQLARKQHKAPSLELLGILKWPCC